MKEKDVGQDDKIGGAAIPFSCLRKGIRSIPISDLHNTRFGPYGSASLLAEIQY